MSVEQAQVGPTSWAMKLRLSAVSELRALGSQTTPHRRWGGGDERHRLAGVGRVGVAPADGSAPTPWRKMITILPDNGRRSDRETHQLEPELSSSSGLVRLRGCQSQVGSKIKRLRGRGLGARATPLVRLSRVNVYFRLPSSSASGMAWMRFGTYCRTRYRVPARRRHTGIDMLITCLYVYHMSTMIQLRHVPDDLHRKLKARAALAGCHCPITLYARSGTLRNARRSRSCAIA